MTRNTWQTTSRYVLFLEILCLLGCEGTSSHTSDVQPVVTNPSPLNRLPQPTDPDAYHADRKDKKEQRKRYIEEMHRSAPDVDWQRIDQATRQKKARVRFDSFTLKEVGSEISVAGGLLQGTWKEKGSANMAGRMHVGEYAPNSQQLYGGSAGGTIWRSNLKGDTWTPLNDGMRIENIIMLRVLAHADEERIIAASGESNTPGITFSDDGGNTWDWSESGLENLGNEYAWLRKAVIANDPYHTIWLLSKEWNWDDWGWNVCLYRSRDQGDHFTRMTYYDDDARLEPERMDLWTDRYGSGQVFMLQGNRLFHLGDSSGHPTLISTVRSAPDQIKQVRLTGRDTESGTVLYALFTHEDWSTFDQQIRTYSEIFVSRDTGRTWKHAKRPAQILSHDGVSEEVIGTPFGHNSLDCGIYDPNLVYLGGVLCWKSYNAGESWSFVNHWQAYYDDPNTKVHADIPGVNPLLDEQGEEFILLSTDGGAYLSRNNLATVRNISLSDLNVSQYYSVHTLANRNIIMAGSQDQGIQRSLFENNGVREFEQLLAGDFGHIVSNGYVNSIWSVYPGMLLYCYNLRGDVKFDWFYYSDVIHGESLWMPPLLEDPDHAYRIYVGGGNTRDDGTARLLTITRNQQQSFSVTEKRQDFCAKISALAYSPVDTRYRYVLTAEGDFFWSSNRGNSWARSQEPEGPQGHYFYGSSILASPTTEGRVYIAGSGYSNPAVYESQNHGLRFKPMTTGLPDTLVFQLATNPEETMIFAATEVGPYVYITKEKRWYDLAGDAAPDQTYWSVEYIPEPGIARFGTYGRGIWDFQVTGKTRR